MESYQNCYDFSSWVPSVVLAGMLALFQGREAPIPRKYLAKVRLIASCILITSAFLLFGDKDTTLSPRKLNALMVFGFVLNYYFGPRSLGLGNYKAEESLYENTLLESDPIGVPEGARYFSMPKDYDLRRGHRSKMTKRLPEGWGMQVDGGDYYKGTHRMHGGRTRMPKKTRVQRRYVAEELGEWSSAEESFNRINKWGGGRDKYNFHVPQQIGHRNKYADVLTSLPANHLKSGDNQTPRKANNPMTMNYSKEKPKEVKEPEEKKKKRQSMAIVTDLTNLGDNNVFKINPMEEQQLKMATKVQEAHRKVFKHPTFFQINPLKIAGVNDSNQEEEPSPSPIPRNTDNPVGGQQSSGTKRPNVQTLPSKAAVYPAIATSRDERKKQLAALSSRRESLPKMADRMGGTLRSPMAYSRFDAGQVGEDDTVPGQVGLTYPAGHDAYHDQERIRYAMAKDRRERRKRRNFRPKIPEVEMHKRREAKKRAARLAREARRKRLREEVEAEAQDETLYEEDPWARAFDGTVARYYDSPLLRLLPCTKADLCGVVCKWKNALFLLLVALSHLGYYLLTTRKGTFSSIVRSWSQVSGQNLMAIPVPEEGAPSPLPLDTPISENPVLVGYMEAFLLFCLVKGSIDCVDKIFSL